MAKTPKPPADQLRSNFIREQEKRRQEGARTAVKAAEMKRALARLRSGKPTAEPRRNPTRDERIAQGIVEALRAGHRVQLSSKSGQGVTDYRSMKRRIKSPKGTVHHVKFWTPSWDHAGDALKALAWSQVMRERGGETFTLRLGEKNIHEAKSSAVGFVPFMLERIRRPLTKIAAASNMLPEFFLFAEAAYGVEAHLHGAMILPEAPAARRAWRRALMEAGGDYVPRKNQLLFRTYSSAAGWANYVRKWKLGTAIQLGDTRVCACSNSIRSEAQDWYDNARRTGSPLS